MRWFNGGKFANVLTNLFVVGITLSLVFVYTEQGNPLAYKFVKLFFFYAVFYLIYTIVTTLLKMKKLEKQEFKRRGMKFAVVFLGFGILLYASDYLLGIKTDIDIIKKLAMSFGLAFGISFVDLMFLKE